MTEVKTGYKQTDIGVIPEDWDMDDIKNVCLITTGNKNTQDRKETGRYPFFVRSQKVENIDTYSFDGEAVLTAGDGVGTGKIFHYINGKFDFHQRVYKMSRFSKRVDGFYFYKYFSNHFYGRIMSMTAKSSVDSVRMEMIVNMKIPLPKVEEQKAIAVALSDVDGLIESLEQLIAKKRDMKTATMQQLLTGKKRLPGFEISNGYRETDIGLIPNDWDIVPISFLCDIVSGGTPSTSNSAFWFKGTIPWCTPSDITATSGKHIYRTERNITLLGLSKSSANLLPEGSLLLCSRATIGEIKIAMTKIATNQGFKSLICNSVENEFMYYKVLTLKNKLLQFSIGSTFLEFSKKDITKLQIDIPKPKEQKAIAEVLSDMDAEIDALEQRLEKARHLKTGMMQELLTGKTRLIKTDSKQDIA